jgi:uncharacterized membrane protein
VITRKLAVGAVATLLGIACAALPVHSADAAKAKEFKNCTALNKAYPHGVGKPGARDHTSGTPVTTFKRSKALYVANKKSDRDKDGIACEKA